MVRPNQLLHPTQEPARPWTAGPRTGLLAGQEAHFGENDPPYGELALVCPDGQTRHALDWRSDQPVRLLRNVMRLTAPNPGMMTGPGTNSYLVGDPSTGYIVIDPGPDEPTHVERLWHAAGGDIRMIVCTHSHADHAPAARPLQEMVRTQRTSALAGVAEAPPILGLPSATTARAASHFAPDQELPHQVALTLVSQAPGANITHTLKIIHTPGHAANHLCLVLVEDGLLFSGDHILNGSTTVIDPPDGDMTAYLDSLDALSAACNEHSIEFILPAHGHVLGQAARAISHLKAHRLKREAKIHKVMQAHPDGTLDDWVVHAYDDVHQRLWPLAKRSLLAHVQRLRDLG
jgi:recombination protein RecT